MKSSQTNSQQLIWHLHVLPTGSKDPGMTWDFQLRLLFDVAGWPFCICEQVVADEQRGFSFGILSLELIQFILVECMPEHAGIHRIS